MRRFSLKVLPVLLLTVAASATADDEKSIAQILTCNLQSDNQNFSNSWKLLEPRAAADGHGGYRIAGRYRVGELCIENARIAAAFHVFVATASLCGEGTAPLIDFLKTTESGLTPKTTPPKPGLIAAFEAPKYTAVLYRGEPQIGGEPDPASKRLSYMCAYQAAGPQ
jgi:hypothetical protein